MISFPDITKWNISNYIKIDNIFDNCDSSNNSLSLNSKSKDNMFSLKISYKSGNHNSENSVFDKEESSKNNINFLTLIILMNKIMINITFMKTFIQNIKIY